MPTRALIQYRSEAPNPGYAPGDVIVGKYQLERVIGEGGMGAVWQGKNLALDVDVAIKLIHHGLATADACKRLVQEARTAARIDHPNIVRIFDFGETDAGDPFIVMELLRGEDLRTLLQRSSRLRAGVAVPIMLNVAGALAAAHAKGVIHRDLKPENVFLVAGEGETWVPKVVDFGVAKFSEGGVNRAITQAGAVVGSPDYMSPEQASGSDDLDQRTDVWSLCVVLYEVLTGTLPFTGVNANSVMHAILTEVPTPTTTHLAGDDALWSIVEQGLARLRGDRFQTMRALGEALAAWALDNDIDTDISGASIERQWLGGRGVASGQGRSLSPSVSAAPSSRRSLTEIDPPSADLLRSASMSTPPASMRSWSTRASAAAVAAALALVAIVVVANIARSHTSADDANAALRQASTAASGAEPARTSTPPHVDLLPIEAPPEVTPATSAGDMTAKAPESPPSAAASAQSPAHSTSKVRAGPSKNAGMPVPVTAPF